MLPPMSSPVPGYAGMTVNERLYAAGLLGVWDRAIDDGARATAIDILGQVELASQAENIVDAVLATPGKYGFPRKPYGS